MPVANTLPSLQVVSPVVRAARQALVHLLVDRLAMHALPPGLAVALPLDAGTVVRARRILAVLLLARLAFPARLAVARAADALAVPGAVGHAAVRLRDVALRPLPALLAVAEAAAVLTVAGTENRADA